VGPTKKTTKKKTPKPRKNPAGKAHLLVVDDEVDFTRLIQKSLAPLGYRVDTATSATQAIALQRKRSYDLALVDMRMPEMTGLELLQYLKMRDKSIFVIIMTAYGSFAVGIESLKLGACDYLAKPFSLAALKQKTKEAIRRRAQLLEEQRVFFQKENLDEL
jgi:two-component system nitrogen regulation response regulator GlnG